MIKKVQLYVNSTKENACILAKEIKAKLKDYGYILTKNDPDLVIGFGGDGTLLRWLAECDYQTNAKYIGINCGTLGFMQDFDITDIDEFIKNIPNYKEEEACLIQLSVTGKDSNKDLFLALNEFKITSNIDNPVRLKVEVNDELLEHYVGTSLLFSTPTGSTAHNRSAHGSILFPSLKVIQITPSENTINRHMRSLTESFCIPNNMCIKITPDNESEIKILSDSNKVFSGLYDNIIITNSNISITKLTNTNFIAKVRDKLI